MTTTTEVQDNCSGCLKPLPEKHHIRITLVNYHQNPVEERVVSRVCSLKCLVVWAHNYGTAEVLRMASGVRQLVTEKLDTARRWLDALRGPPRS